MLWNQQSGYPGSKVFHQNFWSKVLKTNSLPPIVGGLKKLY
jgi:hypothetical protein